jgi:hypothetical protein
LDDHHRFLCPRLLERIDELTSRIQELPARIDQQVAPFVAQVAQLDAVTGIAGSAPERSSPSSGRHGRLPDGRAAGGVAKFAPQATTSAGNAKTAATGNGNRGWPPPWASSPSPPGAPTPSSASAPGASPTAAAHNAPLSRSPPRS